MNSNDSDASQPILNSISNAKIIVGTRVFTIPVNNELVEALETCEPKIEDTSMKMTNFMSAYLSERKANCHIEICGKEIPFNLPTYMYDSLEMETKNIKRPDILTDEFGSLVRGFIPTSMRPPTNKQLWFAKKIALTLDIELTENDTKSVNLCSDFIDKNRNHFLRDQERLNQLSKEARLAGRGYIVTTLRSREVPIEEIMKLMDVNNPDTLFRHCKGYMQFVKNYENLTTKEKGLRFRLINEMISETYAHIEIALISEDLIKEFDSEKFKF